MTAVRRLSVVREPELWRAVGNTPLIPLEVPEGARGRLWLKAEWLNPGGSVKDRTARAILRDGLERGELPAKRLLDASSGNTGIAYAMLGAAAGVGVTICLPGNASPERKALLEIYGADVIVTDRMEGTEGAARRAQELADTEPDRYFYADQYSNPANPRAHRETTGPEVWFQTAGRLTHFVAAMGTTGTMMGTGGYLKERNASIRLVGVQPDSPYHGLEGLKHLATTSSPPALYNPALPMRWPRSPRSGPTTRPGAWPVRRGSSWDGRRERRSPPPGRFSGGSLTPRWSSSAAIPAPDI